MPFIVLASLCPSGAPPLASTHWRSSAMCVQGVGPTGRDLRDHPGLSRRQSLLRGANENDLASTQEMSYLAAATASLGRGGMSGELISVRARSCSEVPSSMQHTFFLPECFRHLKGSYGG